MRRTTSRPDSSGRQTSRNTRSGSSRSISATASAPSLASPTSASHSTPVAYSRRLARACGSSSTSTARTGAAGTLTGPSSVPAAPRSSCVILPEASGRQLEDRADAAAGAGAEPQARLSVVERRQAFPQQPQAEPLALLPGLRGGARTIVLDLDAQPAVHQARGD